MSSRVSCPHADDPASGTPEREMRESETRLRIVQETSRIGMLLVAELDFDQVLQRLADEATAACGASLGAFFYSVPGADGESDLFFALSGAPREAFAHLDLPRRTDFLIPTFHGRTVERLADVTLDPRHEQDAHHFGIPVKNLLVRSYLALPVSSRSGEVLGRLFVAHTEPGVFSSTHEMTLVGIAGHAAIALDNARLVRAARASRDELMHTLAAERAAWAEAESEHARIASLFHDAPAAIATWRGPEHVFDSANPRYQRFVGRTDLVGRALRSALPELAGQSVLDIFDRVYRTGEPFFTAEMPISLDRDGSGKLEQGVFSFTLVPVREEGRVAGLMAVGIDITAQKRAEHALREGTKRAALGADVGVAMARNGSLEDQLLCCAQAIVANLDAALARIWTLNKATQKLELRASAGLYTHLDGPHSRVPVGAFKIGLIAQERAAHLSNDVLSDPRVGDKAWAAREGLVAFAGYPLIVDGSVVGVMAMFSRQPLGAETLHALACIADAIAMGIDRRRSERLTEQLRRSEERYRSLIEATTQTVWITNPEGEMVGEQPGWAALTGQSQQEYQGHGWANAVHPDDRPHTVARWNAAARSGELFVCEHRLRRHDGEWRHFRSSSAPIRAADGSIREWFGLHTDVTEKKLVDVERERLIAELKRSNEDLDQFAYVTSHDLKAPLRGIANLSQWVEEDLAEKISEEGREQMRLLRGRVHRLEALINGILSYSRAGRTRERLELVDVGQLAREVVEMLAPPTGLEVEIPADLPTIETERVPLQQVLMNLLSNAIKHAKKADPRVSITCSESRDGYSFTIKDNGPGIAPAFHQRIWMIFQTLEPRDKVEATGIGLSIVKKIVESRGGRVWIDSIPGAGAEFHFSWPVRAKAPR